MDDPALINFVPLFHIGNQQRDTALFKSLDQNPVSQHGHTHTRSTTDIRARTHTHKKDNNTCGTH